MDGLVKAFEQIWIENKGKIVGNDHFDEIETATSFYWLKASLFQSPSNSVVVIDTAALHNKYSKGTATFQTRKADMPA